LRKVGKTPMRIGGGKFYQPIEEGKFRWGESDFTQHRKGRGRFASKRVQKGGERETFENFY